MSYYFTTTVEGSFDDVIGRVTDAMKKEGFGIISDIDVRAALKKKLDADFRPYRILGVCNPPFAFKALQLEDKIGIMMPCNVVVQHIGEGKVEVSAVDPAASMMAIRNEKLAEVAGEVGDRLRKVIEGLT
jgi:uncharacterized protein (DUF302 family)